MNKVRKGTEFRYSVHFSSYCAFALQVGVWIDAGSRNETNANNGVAHLLERLAFTVIIFASLLNWIIDICNKL